MKILPVSIVLVALAMAVALGNETATSNGPTTVIRDPGSFGLGEEGSLLKISPSESGKYSWSLTWLVAYPSMSQSVTITKEDYLNGRAWFAFVEAPGRAWFFNGIDELMVATRTDTGISQQYAFRKKDAYPLFETCPPEVLEALPDDVADRLTNRRR